jgi:hypothetical protein
VQEAIKLRGITDPWNVVCGGGPASYFNTTEEQGDDFFA